MCAARITDRHGRGSATPRSSRGGYEALRELVVGAPHRRDVLAVDVDRTVRRFARAGQADADVGALRLARAVDDATHDSQGEGLDPFTLPLPVRHPFANVILRSLGQLLERRTRRPPAAGACGNAGRERPQPQRLQYLARGVDFFAPIAARLRRERYADGVADALAEQDAHGGGGPDKPLQPHAGLGEAQVERLLRLARQVTVNREQVARARDLAGDDDLVPSESRLERELGRLDGRYHHALVENVFRRAAQFAVGVLLHLGDHEVLVERSSVDADANRLVVIDGNLADGRKTLVAARAGADVAGIDAVLVERGRAIRVARQQQVAVVMEVADERRLAAGIEHSAFDLGDSGSRFRHVDRDADEFRPRFRQLDALARGGGRVHRIGHRHRLDGDGRTPANLQVPDAHADRSV